MGMATASPAAATPARETHEPAATPARTCAGEATAYTVTFTERPAIAWPVAVRDSAILPTGFVRVPFRVRPEPKFVRVPLVYRGYMKRAYGRGWHPDFTYVAAPAYRAYTYISVASAPAGLLR